VNRNNIIGKHGKVVQKHFTVTVRVDSYYTLLLLKKSSQFKTGCKDDNGYISQQKATTKKGYITFQHMDYMAMCY